MFGIMRALEEEGRIIDLEKAMKPARITGDKTCIRSGFCCFRRPAVPTPDEIEKLASSKNMSGIDFINTYCTIDTNHKVYYPKLAGLNTKDLVGKWLDSESSFNEGACIFLSEKGEIDGKYKCIVHEIKPQACRSLKCWEKYDKDKAFTGQNAWKPNILLTKYGIDAEKMENEYD